MMMMIMMMMMMMMMAATAAADQTETAEAAGGCRARDREARPPDCLSAIWLLRQGGDDQHRNANISRTKIIKDREAQASGQALL